MVLIGGVGHYPMGEELFSLKNMWLGRVVMKEILETLAIMWEGVDVVLRP
jgi:hypothetical protein